MKEDLITDSIPRAWVDAEWSLATREVESLDRIIYGVVRSHAIAQKLFPTVPVPKGTRYRKVSIAKELREPIFTDDFMTEDIDEVKKAEYTYWLAFMHKDFQLNMIDMHASQTQKYYNMTIETLNIREAVKTVADYKERVLWRGYAIMGPTKIGVAASTMTQGTIDGNVLGIINETSGDGTYNTFTAAGDGGAVDAAGDGPLSVGAAMSSLIADDYFGPYQWVMSPNIMGQLGINFNSTTQISDLERMQAMIDIHGNKILEGLDVTHYVSNTDTNDDDYGTMLMFQRKTPDGEPTAMILEAYPVAHHPIQMSSLGIKGKVIWGGRGGILRKAAFTKCVDTDLT